MAVVKKKRVRWTPPVDSDVVAHKVFVAPETTPIVDGVSIQIDMPITQVILPDDFPAGTFVGEGNFIVGVCAIDDVGNEGDIAEITNPFDFIAPGVPTNLVVETV